MQGRRKEKEGEGQPGVITALCMSEVVVEFGIQVDNPFFQLFA